MDAKAPRPGDHPRAHGCAGDLASSDAARRRCRAGDCLGSPATPNPDRDPSTEFDDGTGGPPTLATPPLEPASAAASSPTIAGEEPVRIAEIQGARHRSPFEGFRTVTTGVVTAPRAGGFFLQDPEPDDDPATAEGLFVQTTEATDLSALVRLGPAGGDVETAETFDPVRDALAC